MSTVPQIKGYYETYWNKGKDTFSGDQQGYAENFRRWMAKELSGLPARAAILEVGCGDGSFTKELVKFSPDVTAIDISESQIQENTKRFGGITFLQHDVAERFPFEDGAFDVIWCSEVLEHLFDPAFALREMRRIIKPGGKLMVTVPYHGRVKNILIALFNFDQHYTPSNPHIRFYTNKTLSRIVREAGFSDVQVKTCGMNVPLRDLIVPTNILLRATKPLLSGMKASHAVALLLIPLLSVIGSVLATWFRPVRDAFFFLMVILCVVAERLDVNFLSEAWYRGTTRGLQVSLLEIFAVSILVGCLLSRRNEEDGPRWFWPGSLGLMLLYLLYATISVIVSQPKLFGLFELSKIVGAILVFVASAAYARGRREWTILIVALGLAVGFEGIWAVKQKFISHLERVAGTLDHANSLSMYLCLTTPLLVAVAYAGWTRWLRNFGGICAGLGAIGLFLTVSRAGIPVFSAVCFATFIFCASWKFTYRMVLVRTGLAVAGVVLVAALWSQIAQRYGEASLHEEYLDANVDGRGIYLRLAKNIASDHFFGIGLNNWSYHVSRTYGPQLGFRFEDYDYLVSVYGTQNIAEVFGDAYLAAPAHNLAALTLGELGIPGLLLFLAMWGRWFTLGLPFLFGPRDDPMRTLGVGLFFCICGIFGQSITEWVFRQTPIIMTFHILLGVLAAAAQRKRAAVAARSAAPAAEPVGTLLTPQGI